MAKRSQLYTLMPWGGGLNDSADPGAIPPTDLVVADNILYTTAGSRIKRPGLEYIDNIELPAVTSIERTSNVVTITFASPVASGSNNMLVSGEAVTVVCGSNSAFDVTALALSSVSGSTVTYASTGADVPAISNPEISITRASSTVGVHDYWYYNASNNTKAQLKLMLTSQGKLFKFDGSGNRLEVGRATQTVTGATPVAPSTVSIFTLNNHGFKTGTAVQFDALTGGAGLAINTVYYVERINDNTFYLSASLGGSRLAISTTLTSSTMSVPFALTLPITKCSFLTFNERCLIAADGIKNWPILFDPSTSSTTYTYIKNAAPNASILGEHEGRVIANDKTAPDRLHYSSPGDHTEWQGYGDSGVVDIGFGDGDPVGITAIYPTFKGALFVSKSERLYRLPDPGISLSRIELVSSGIGAVSHAGCAPVDMDDVLFISKRGFHSLAATSSYGDFSGAYLSEKIQNAFQEFTASRRALTWGRYFSKYNSVFFTVAESAASRQDSIYVYNIKFKEWYRWPNVTLQCVTTAKSGNNDVLIFGTQDSRLASLSSSSYSDFGAEPYNYIVKTGKIYVDNNPSTVKMYKRIGFIFKPQGSFTFTANIKIDNLPQQTVKFEKATGGDLLGTTFVLGESTLAYASNMDPFMQPIDGIGRGIQITVENTSPDQQVTIYGMIIEWVPAGMAQETFISGSTTE